MSEQSAFVPIKEVAQYFSVSTSTVRSWVRAERIPRDTYIKLGNTYRFNIAAMAEALTRDALDSTPAVEPDPAVDEVPQPTVRVDVDNTLDDLVSEFESDTDDEDI
jgi:excisionase family DNA binding protein